MVNETIKTGARVKIARSTYWCSECKNNHGQYRYGASIDCIPINTIGRVMSLSGNTVAIDLSDKGIINFHMDELQGLVSLIETLPGINQLDAHPLFELAENSPIFVVDGKVYSLGEKTENLEGNYFYNKKFIGKETNGILEIGTLESLDELALSRDEETLKNLRKGYAQQVWQDLNLESKLGTRMLDIPQLIAAQVFPYFRDEKYDSKVTEMLGLEKSVSEKKEKNIPRTDLEKKLEEVTQMTLKEITDLKTEVQECILREPKEEIQEKRTKKQQLLDEIFSRELMVKPYSGQSILGQAIGLRDFALIGGELVSLIETSDKREDYLALNEKTYSLGAKQNLNERKQDYQKLLSKQIRLETIDREFSREKVLEAAKKTIEGLGEFAGVKNYEEGEFGFFTSDNQYFIYLKVPEFIMKCPYPGKVHRGKSLSDFYYSEESAIASSVTIYEESIQFGNPYRYYPKRNGFTSFCMGEIKLETDGESKAEIAAKNLILMKKMLMLGHSLDWYSGAPQYAPTPNDYAKSKIKSGVLLLEGARISK